ncbi:MAG: uroporphyrinogen-III synthase [Opitutales bacterium]|nr:uroporphyrinogen-III synthase [Opitutales bacterium]
MKSSLKNHRIAITRASDQSSTLRRRLETLGAHVLELPLIETRSAYDKATAADVFAEVGSYDWIVFTSANGVRYFFKLFIKHFNDIRALGIMRIAAIGKGTAKALAKYYLTPDLMPDDADSESLGKALIEDGVENRKMLLITGNLNRETLVTSLEQNMAIVDAFQVYETVKSDLSDCEDALDFCKAGADALLFCSPSAVSSFVDQAAALQRADAARVPKTFSIGQVTTDAMKKAGIPVDVTAHESSIDGLIEALEQRFSEE